MAFGSQEKKLNGTVIVTYRCNARCSMCNRYKAPSKPEEEISIETIKKLPKMYFTNITGGEPFIRTDLKEIVRELYKKSDRIVISTNGFFTDRIVDLAKEFPQVGIRISIEGLEKTNNEIRGLEDGFRRGYRTLRTLRKMGMKDVGFGMTVQDKNAPDLVPLYDISDKMGMEFATASLHNSFYFVEAKNIITDRQMVAENFEKLINKLLKSNSPKKWFRAYFNHGLINYIYGQKRLLPCDMSFDTFFIDPYGDVMPCNGTKDKEVMGNLNTQTWEELWNSKEAEAVRKKVRHCDRQCWMIGSASPAMHKYIWTPALWVAKHKVKALFMKKPYSMYENKICCDYRDGKVTKEALDKCSTCDRNAIANDGLSEMSKAQLLGRTGEEIVEADIAGQLGAQTDSADRMCVQRGNADTYTGRMDKPAGSPRVHELSPLQQAELQVFKEFVRICDEKHLKYYIWGGSFLGAVRHQGFIPWDDDIDVAMPRRDFEKFLKIADRYLPSDMYVSTYKNDPEHVTLVAQVFHKDKAFVLNNATRKVKTGAWVDILVIDGAPKPGIHRKIFGARYLYYRMLNQFSYFEKIVNLNKKRPWYERAAIWFAQFTKIEKRLDAVKIGDRFHRLLKSNRYEQCDDIGTFMGAAKMGEIIPKYFVGEGKPYPFEDMVVNGPEEYDAYLTHFYGDYMTPPPPEMRNRHNVTADNS